MSINHIIDMENRLCNLEEKLYEISKIIQEQSCSIDEFARVLMALTGADTTKQKSDLEIFQPIIGCGDENWIITNDEEWLLAPDYGDVF